MKNKKLSAVWNDPINTGIFTFLKDYHFAYITEENYKILNIEYFLNHSGNKWTSPLVYNLTWIDGKELSHENKENLALVISEIFREKWDKIYQSYTADYNPIENYNMVETEQMTGNVSRNATESMTDENTHEGRTTDTNTDTVTNNLTKSETGTDTLQKSKQTDGTNSSSGNVINQLYAFDSSNFQNTDKNDSEGSAVTHATETATDTETRNLSTTDTGTVRTDSNRTIGDTSGDTREVERTNEETTESTSGKTLKRSGNIGVTTSQQMIQSTIDLYNGYTFFEGIFSDIDTIFTLSIY